MFALLALVLFVPVLAVAAIVLTRRPAPMSAEQRVALVAHMQGHDHDSHACPLCATERELREQRVRAVEARQRLSEVAL